MKKTKDMKVMESMKVTTTRKEMAYGSQNEF